MLNRDRHEEGEHWDGCGVRVETLCHYCIMAPPASFAVILSFLEDTQDNLEASIGLGIITTGMASEENVLSTRRRLGLRLE